MSVLSTAVAGGPFLASWARSGGHGNVRRHCPRQCGHPHSHGSRVAGALIATVVGLFVAIPAMFAYNFMVTAIRNLTQELDAFATRFAAQISLSYVERSAAP